MTKSEIKQIKSNIFFNILAYFHKNKKIDNTIFNQNLVSIR